MQNLCLQFFLQTLLAHTDIAYFSVRWARAHTHTHTHTRTRTHEHTHTHTHMDLQCKDGKRLTNYLKRIILKKIILAIN